MNTHIVFDLDGTLVDSLPGIAEGLNRALRYLGLQEHSPAAIRKMIGSGAANLCAKALGYANAQEAPAAELEALHGKFRQEYPTCWQGAYTPLYAGIADLLTKLSANGARLAVLSNKPHDVTEPMVRSLFPHIPFSHIMGHTGQFPRKPAPDALLHIIREWGVEAKDVVMVGDSLYDARTANNAGCQTALVAWGYAEVSELAAWPAPVFGSVDELHHYLTTHHA